MNLMPGVVKFTIDPLDWDVPVHIVRPIPKKGDPWGVLRPLEGTVWGDLIIKVDGEIFSHAMHRRVLPLLKALGRPPEANLRRIPPGFQWCQQYLDKTCLMARSLCKPGKKMPECYEAPHPDIQVQQLAALVCLAWAQDYYVMVVIGEEFSLS